MNDLTRVRRSRRTLPMLAGLALLGLALVGGLGLGAGSVTAAQSAYAPVNSAAPTISGTPQQSGTLVANPGTWAGDQPIVFSFQWLRCNAGGQSCVAIPNATAQSYQVQAADVNNTVRVQVTGRNNAGSATATSAQTAKIGGPPGPAGAIKLSNGETSIPVTSVSLPQRLVIDRVSFSPNPVRTRQTPIQIRVKVKDNRGNVVRDALVFVRSTPIVTTTAPEQRTGQDGWATMTVTAEKDFPIRDGYNVQFFVRARKAGEDILAGVSTRRLVQVATNR